MLRKSLLGTILVISCGLLLAMAQTPDSSPLEELKIQMIGKAVALRHLTPDSVLKYDEFGKVKGKLRDGDWTLHGRIEISQVELKNRILTITGNRLAYSFKDWESTGRPLTVRTPETFSVEIVRGNGGSTSLGNELKKAFLTESEFPENLPTYWRGLIFEERASDGRRRDS